MGINFSAKLGIPLDTKMVSGYTFVGSHMRDALIDWISEGSTLCLIQSPTEKTPIEDYKVCATAMYMDIQTLTLHCKTTDDYYGGLLAQHIKNTFIDTEISYIPFGFGIVTKNITSQFEITCISFKIRH